MRNLILLLLLFCLLPFTTKAQKIEFNGEFLLFREAKTKQPVLIINDSLVYKGNAMRRIAFKHTEYPAKLQEYKFFNIDTKTYLVHEGCGPVLEYRNDSIVRIDNSFLHRNQYRAVRFVYNKEIYFYGGYGLFTFKNILTKYDFQTREWLEVKTFSEVPMETSAGAFSYLINDDLYVFGGNTKDETKVEGAKQFDNTIWRLHLPTMQWSCQGKVSGISKLEYLSNRLICNNQEKTYFITDVFNVINPEKNTLEKFELKFYSLIFSNYFEGKNIICILSDDIKKTKYFAILPIITFKGKQLSTSTFITPLSNDHKIAFFLCSIIILLGLILLFIYRKKIQNKMKPFNGILYNQEKELFFYKSKPITVFDEQEKRLLLYLLEQNNQFVSLNNINQLFEHSYQPETISATVKRREQTVTRLLTKVSKITGIDEKELIVERKNSEDKRIKDLKILPNLLKME
ncbi:MAG: hypothetical protein ACOYBS_01340 [Flavobacterium sp.]